MRIGVLREVKTNENRVALTPGGAFGLTQAGHEVFVETDAGAGSHFLNEQYAAAGATVVPAAAEVWERAQLALKVKEPQPAELGFLHDDLVLFTYLHLAASKELTEAMLASRMESIAYENVTERDGTLPLLAPMSEIAGRLSVQVGANALLRHNGGRGILLSGVPGTERGHVVVLGGGVAGRNAIDMAIGLGADVTVLDISVSALRHIDDQWGGRVQTLMSTPDVIAEQVSRAELVIGAVLVPGARAPKLVSTLTIESMPAGAVLVDVAIDQGGCFEPSRPTTHREPTFKVGDSLLYCVANMPAAVPRTSTLALTNATLPFVKELANKGFHAAVRADPRLAAGVTTVDGRLYLAGVAEAHGLPESSLSELLA